MKKFIACFIILPTMLLIILISTVHAEPTIPINYWYSDENNVGFQPQNIKYSYSLLDSTFASTFSDAMYYAGDQWVSALPIYISPAKSNYHVMLYGGTLAN